MKKLFFIIPIAILTISLTHEQEKPNALIAKAKDELILDQNNFEKFNTSASAPYVHCSCEYGVYSGPKGKEECTFCGKRLSQSLAQVGE